LLGAEQLTGHGVITAYSQTVRTVEFVHGRGMADTHLYGQEQTSIGA
jgi:hypothetical protein